MADIGRSSFIPKETPGLTPSKIRRKRTFYVFSFLTTSLFVGSLALAGGVYFLHASAEKKLDTAKDALIAQKNLFKPEYISEIRDFDNRLRIAEALMENHIAPLKIFSALEELTKESVQFTSFALEHSPSREILLTLEGVTPEFKSLALQEIQFSEDQILKDIVFSQVSLDEGTEEDPEPAVAFSLSGTVDLANVRYDGTPVYTPEPTAFIETNDSLAIEESVPTVLGESVTFEDI